MANPDPQLIKRLFDEAAELPHAERGPFLERSCGQNVPLREQVESLLAALDSAPTFLATPTADPAAATIDTGSLGQEPNSTIGPYRLIQLIGEGGFGEVWLAEQEKPIARRVALKIIKPGMDTRAVLARFEQERQALAVMNHPNIARVFDAGATPIGRPYFVMEHVVGQPLTDHCDRHRLNIRERLQLFIPVCEAVQHAHHKGIIHRDLKPSNIIVATYEGRAVPKVIDFGIAKAVSHVLTTDSIFTEQGRLVGTPEYMSPEQADMGSIDVDTRTDVYALGVVLYELLSGFLPFDSKALRAAGLHAICRIIMEHEPPRPSARLATADDAASAVLSANRHTQRDPLARELRRELDWIPLKAIRKDRADRYDTPMDLAQDVQRYLRGEALEAGPRSTAYRLRKLVRRNRGLVFAAGAVMLALLLGLCGTLWQARRAGDRAEAATLAMNDLVEARRNALILAGEAGEQRNAANTKAAEAEFEAYVANLSAADSALSANEPWRVRASLDACPAHLRGWEWRWLNARSDTSLAVLRGQGECLTAAFSPDGTRVVTASRETSVRVWETETGRELAVLRGHQGPIRCAAYNSDGTRIVTGSEDNTARVWNAADGAELVVLRGHEDWINSCEFGAGDTRIVTASGDKTARVWDAANGTELVALRGHRNEVMSASFSTDAARVVTASYDWTSRVWDAADGKQLTTMRIAASLMNSAAFSPDGARVVVATSHCVARICDATSGEELIVMRGHVQPLNGAAFSPDGARLLTASSDRTARVWDATSGTERTVLRGHQKELNSAAFSRDGRREVTASSDGTARVWDAAGEDELTVLRGHADWVNGASFSADGTRVVTASSDKTARVWDMASGHVCAVLRGHEEWVDSAAFSPDAGRVVTASGDMTARVWDAFTGKELAVLRGHEDFVVSAAFSPDSTLVVTSGNKTARVWDALTGHELAVLRGHALDVTSAVFFKDGKRVLTASDDATARIWDARNGNELLTMRGHTDRLLSATLSPDEQRVVTTSWDTTARVWDAATGKELAVLTGHTGRVNSSVISADGERVVTASADATARVWDMASGKALVILRGHEWDVKSAAFSADGRRVVTASIDRTVRVWDATSGQGLAVLRGHEASVTQAAFSPDGSKIMSASEDNTARVWDSVPYRERYPAIARMRAAERKMRPIVTAAWDAGEAPDTMAGRIATDAALQPEERTAALIVVCELREAGLKAGSERQKQ